MARTYLEKFYFPLHATFIEGNLYGRDLTNEEVIECLPCILQVILYSGGYKRNKPNVKWNHAEFINE